MGNEIIEAAKEKMDRRIARARSMTGEERFMEGFGLSQESLERMKAGVRFRHPEFTEQEVMDRINENMKKIRAAEKVTTITP
jgi:hypothetical protein